MRKKKFRKITNRNAASIYGKIVKMVAMWERKIFHNPSGYKIMFSYLKKLGPMNLDFVVEDTVESFGVDIKGCQNEYQIYIDITSVGLQDVHNDFHFVLCDGCKVSLTGSSIIIKYGGKLYCARLVKIIRFPMMASDFDGDRLKHTKIYAPSLYVNLKKLPYINPQLISPLDSPWQCVHSAMHMVESIKGDNIKTVEDNFTEDDLPPIEDVMNGVSELERQIGEQPRDMQFKIPKDWDIRK